MDKWTELRTAYKLAKFGTLSETARDIGVHRSTVMRHIDALEERIGVVLFQRNDKGYIPTEAGLEIMHLGEVTDSQYAQLLARLQNREQVLEGTLTITCVSEIAGLLMPTIQRYQSEHPGMRVEIVGDIRNYDLEYGEADIAIRSGDKPTTPDNVVLPFVSKKLVFCAHKDYIAKHGMLDTSTIHTHKFVALNEHPAHLLWNEWIYAHVPEENIVVSASSQQILTYAILAGCGIGVMPNDLVAENEKLVVVPYPDTWQIEIWILVHRDMFSMLKIRAFIDILRELGDVPLPNII